ncbi:MAG TPA: hypothetical protein VHT96_01530 [Clostridia bacterium]|nr:hypothetical protein [Clostridia bacterium]
MDKILGYFGIVFLSLVISLIAFTTRGDKKNPGIKVLLGTVFGPLLYLIFDLLH